MEVPCCAPLLPSDGYAREGGGVGLGRCPARVGIGHGQGAVRWPGNSGRLWTCPEFEQSGPLALPDADPGPRRWVKPTEPTGPTPEPPPRPTPRRRLLLGPRPPRGRVRPSPRFRSSAVLSLRRLVAGRPAVAKPRAGRVGGRAARDPRQRVALTATLLLEQGVELVVIKELLGHAHIGVTATVYAHVRLRLQRDALTALGNSLDRP